MLLLLIPHDPLLIPQDLVKKVKITIHFLLFIITVHNSLFTFTVHDTVHSEILPI